MDDKVRLVFSGALLEGYRPEDVQRRLGLALGLSPAKVAALFTGGRVVVKSSISRVEAARWVVLFMDQGAILKVEPRSDDEPAPPPPEPAAAPAEPTAQWTGAGMAPPTTGLRGERAVAAPAAASSLRVLAPVGASPAPGPVAPSAAAMHGLVRESLRDIPPPRRPPPPPADDGPLSTFDGGGVEAAHAGAAPRQPRKLRTIRTVAEAVEEEVVCTNCGERQSMRAVCRACGADMARAALDKQARELAARMGAPPGGRSNAQMLDDPSLDEPAELASMSTSGRLPRSSYIAGGSLALTVLYWGLLFSGRFPGVASSGALIGLLIWTVLWGQRLAVLRLHDMNLTGWWSMLGWVPWFGQIAALGLAGVPGSRGRNSRGMPPRQGHVSAAVVISAVLVLSLGFTWRQGWQALGQLSASWAGMNLSGETLPPVGPPPLPPVKEVNERLPTAEARLQFEGPYWAALKHRAIAVSGDGAVGWFGGATNVKTAVYEALTRCERNRGPYSTDCYLLHVDNAWAPAR